MKSIYTVFTLAILFLLAGCKDKSDSTGTLVLTFVPEYDGQPLAIFTTKPYGNDQLQFSHLRMMVADVAALKGASTEVLHDIEEINLTFDNATEAAAGYELRIPNVKVGNYTGLEFGIGVPADLNQKQPADFPSSSPLSKSGNYWVAWSSYIFLRIEGRLDTLGQGDFTLGFVYHTGADELYRVLKAENLQYQIEDGKETKFEIAVDYKKLLGDIDIKENPQNHNPSDIEYIQAITNRLASAIELRY
jgi:hypothetical protein